MARWIAIWGLLLAVAWLAIRATEVDEQGLRPGLVGGVPELQSIVGLRLEACDSWPAFAAAQARPASPDLPVTLGGLYDRLDLQEVRVELGDGLVLAAARGSFPGDRILLREKVRIEDQGGRLLTAAAAEIRQRSVRFPGLVVFHRGKSGEATEMDLELSFAALQRRLR